MSTLVTRLDKKGNVTRHEVHFNEEESAYLKETYVRPYQEATSQYKLGLFNIFCGVIGFGVSAFMVKRGLNHADRARQRHNELEDQIHTDPEFAKMFSFDDETKNEFGITKD